MVRAKEDGIVAVAGHDAIDDGEVQFIKAQHIINIFYGVAHDLDAHVGVRAQVSGEHLRGEQVAGGGRDADGEALDPFEGILERLPRPFGDGRRAMGVFEQQRPVRRGPQFAAAP